MTANKDSTSRQSPIRTGEIEMLEFLSQRRACDDKHREIACSDARGRQLTTYPEAAGNESIAFQLSTLADIRSLPGSTALQERLL
jgi:hypothetical protein